MIRKIPGTMFELDIQGCSNNLYTLGLYYRKEKLFEKSNLNVDDLINAVRNQLEKANLNYPLNRIQTLIDEEIKRAEPEHQTFIESTVHGLIDGYCNQPNPSLNKIILMGLGNAGKTCIYERIFERKKPWELIHSSTTKGIVYRDYKVGPSIKPVIWDLGGQADYRNTYHNQLTEQIFQQAQVLLYVVDVADPDKLTESNQELTWATNMLLKYNPKGLIYVFLHKIDTISDKSTVIDRIKTEFSRDLPLKPKIFPTSIFDESLFYAWSDIIRQTYPKGHFIRNILQNAQKNPFIAHLLLVEKTMGITVASTLEDSDEELLIGMTSLLIITLDRLLNEMKTRTFIDLMLNTEDFGLLLVQIPNSEMILLVQIVKDAFDPLNVAKFNDMRKLIQDLATQLTDLW